MKKILYVLFAIIAITACSKSDDVGGGNNNNNETPKQPEITLNATVSNFSTDGGSSEITFTSSAAWTAEAINDRADGWCSVSPTSGSAGNGKITITTTANDTTDDRTATVVIKSGTTQKTIAVSQKQKNALTVTSSKFEVSADGGEIEIEVKANIDFNVEIEDSAKSWVTHRSTRAIKTSTLLFEVDENGVSEKRKANISISGGGLKETITIYQESYKPSIVLTQNEYTVPSAGETIVVEVKSNVDVTVEMPKDADWITENTTRATSTNTYYFDIKQNDSYDNRSAKIKFVNKANKLNETVTITQAQKDAIVIAEDNYIVNSDGGEVEIEIDYNIDFDIIFDIDWVTIDQTRALQNDKLTFIVEKNETDSIRNGTVFFISKDGAISQAITIAQVATIFEIRYTSQNEAIVIPNNQSGFGANIISNTYNKNEGIITFDNPVMTIGNKAFYDCISLKSIILPKTVSMIMESAFYGCEYLENINIPSNVTYIGNYAFYECKSMNRISIPNGIKTINDHTFAYCSSLRNISLSNNITKIGYAAFAYCRDLENITIPNSVTNIDDAIFVGCVNLKECSISNNVTNIGDRMFYNCSSITDVTIPDNVIQIGGSAFYNCSSLRNIILPDNIIKIGAGAFEKTSLTSIIIPSKVIEIENVAFRDCNDLHKIYCNPTTPPILGSDVFYDNASGRKIYVPAESVDAYKEADGWKNYANEIEGDSYGSNFEDIKDNGTFEW